jgi:hypothetical protein
MENQKRLSLLLLLFVVAVTAVAVFFASQVNDRPSPLPTISPGDLNSAEPHHVHPLRKSSDEAENGFPSTPTRASDEGAESTGSLIIFVETSGGKPLESAQVSVFEDDPDFVGLAKGDIESQFQRQCYLQKALHGRKSITVKLPLGEYLLVAQAPGFSPDHNWHRVTAEARNVHLNLVPSPRIHGRVIDGVTRAEISGAEVFVCPRFRADGRPKGHRIEMDRIFIGSSVYSEVDGSFELTAVPAEILEVRCRAPGYPELLLPGVINRTQELVLALQGTCEVSGVVLDDDELPVENAKVIASLRGHLPVQAAEPVYSDEFGEFAVVGLPSGSLAVGVFAEGFALGKTYLEATQDEGEFLEIRLEPESELKGIVVDDLGKPVAGAYLHIGDIDRAADIGFMYTEADGSWYMKWAHEGALMMMEVLKDGYDGTIVHNLRPPSSSIVTTLNRNGFIRGLVSSNGNPIQKFSVQWLRQQDGVKFERHYRKEDYWSDVESEGGEFLLKSIPAGTHEVRVEAKGFQPAVVKRIEVPPGGRSETVAIELQPSLSVAGHVVDGQGLPVAGAKVALLRHTFGGQLVAGRTHCSSQANGTGEFVLSGLPSGGFDLLVEAKGFGSHIFEDLRASDFPRPLAIRRSGRIAGKAVVEWVSPETTVEIRVTAPNSWIGKQTKPNARGEFAVEELAPGTYLVELHDKWRAGEEGADLGGIAQWVNVAPGQTTSVTLSSLPQCIVTGWVRTPVPTITRESYKVLLLPLRQDRPIAQTRTNEGGRFAIYGISEGDYRVRVDCDQPGWILAQEKRVSLSQAKREVQVDFELLHGGISGTITDENLDPIEAMVSFFDLSNGHEVATTRASVEGGYRVGVTKGDYLIHVSAVGFGDQFEPLDLNSDHNHEKIEHWLEPEARLSIQCVDDLGTALSEVLVRVLVQERPRLLPSLSGTTTSEGFFRVTRLPEGRTEIRASREGYVEPQARLLALSSGEERVETLVLERLGTLSIEVVSHRGKPLEEVAAAVFDNEGVGEILKSGSTSSTGIVQFGGLRAGQYQIQVDRFPPQPAQIRPGETTEILFEWPESTAR